MAKTSQSFQPVLSPSELIVWPSFWYLAKSLGTWNIYSFHQKIKNLFVLTATTALYKVHGHRTRSLSLTDRHLEKAAMWCGKRESRLLLSGKLWKGVTKRKRKICNEESSYALKEDSAWGEKKNHSCAEWNDRNCQGHFWLGNKHKIKL